MSGPRSDAEPREQGLRARPSVSVVMPFAGDGIAAAAALSVLGGIETAPGDELILVDNSGTGFAHDGITLVRAIGEQSPAHARNVGAESARGEWILFLDSDCHAPPGLLDAYFAISVADDVGALAGEVVPAPGGTTLVARYGAARSFLSQEAHLAHPFRPRAVAANLLVRRAAFDQVGGFYEGVRAAEDTDFSWRLQQAGWRLELRVGARVEHRYRSTVSELRAQWRGYAAGRAWLARRYDGFEPQPALSRAARRAWHVPRRRVRAVSRDQARAVSEAGLIERGCYLALDAMLGTEELAGLAMSNRPASDRATRRSAAARVVLVAERFPALGDPMSDFARTLESARVEAASRPDVVDVPATRALHVDYREDDGAAVRALALAQLIARRPLRCAVDLVGRRPGAPKLAALAPSVLRLRRDRGARVHPLGGEDLRDTARRLAALAGRRLEP